MKYLIITLLLLTGCFPKTESYKEKLANSKYKVGETITVDRGFYSGCHLKVTEVSPRYSVTVYIGKSPDCPIKAVWTDGSVER